MDQETKSPAAVPVPELHSRKIICRMTVFEELGGSNAGTQSSMPGTLNVIVRVMSGTEHSDHVEITRTIRIAFPEHARALVMGMIADVYNLVKAHGDVPY